MTSPLAGRYPNLAVLFDDGRTLPVRAPTTKSNGPAQDTPGSVDTGDPITLGSGNVFRAVEDFSTTGSNPLVFSRYYNSTAISNTSAVELGDRWRSTYDRYLHIDSPTLVTAERHTGQVLSFELVNGVWQSDSDMDYSLSHSGSAWILTDPHDNVESYSDDGSGLGWLTKIQARNGYLQTLQYDSIHQLATVTDSFVRSFSFAYQNGLLTSLTTPDGTAIQYGYDGPAVASTPYKLTSATYPTSPATSRRYLYAPAGLLSDVIDQDGKPEASFEYDASQRATRVYAGGNSAIDNYVVSYNDADGSRTVVDPMGLKSVYKFVVLQGVPKVTEIKRMPAGKPVTVSRYTYDAKGYVDSSSDWNGNVTRYINDAHGQPISITEAAGAPLGRVTQITYLPGLHLPTLIVAPRRTTGLTYDASGNLLVVTQTDTTAQTVPYATKGLKRTWSYTYDSFGHVLTADGPRTDVSDRTVFAYDGDNLSSVTDALGHVAAYTAYNPRGEPLSEIDPNGVLTTHVYDTMGRPLTTTVHTSFGNAVTRSAYNAAGRLISQTQPDGSTLSYNYDSAQRLIGVKNSVGESIEFTLDGAGNILRRATKNAVGVIVAVYTQVFDQLGDLVQSIGATPAEVTSYDHDANGNVTAITDPLKHTTYQSFDALNRLVKVTDAAGGVTRYGFDAQDNRISVTSPRGFATVYFFNGFGQVIEVASPDTGVTVFRLDSAGNVVSQTDSRGIVTNRLFDALNRVTRETYPTSPGENIAYAYDSIAGGNKGIGHLTSYTDETGSTSLGYNELGLEARQTKIIAGKIYTTSYLYNLAGKVSQIVYPSGRVVAYGYDLQGRVNGAITRAGATAAWTVLAYNVTYRPFGPLATLTYGNGLTLTRGFDSDGRLTGVVTKSGSRIVQALGIGYDAAGNLTSETDYLTPSRSQKFSYDALNRLRTASGAYATVSYTYDLDSNRLTSTQGGVTQIYSYATNSDRLLSVSGKPTRTITYLANGDVASDSRSGQAATYVYSNRNRLKQAAITGGGAAVYLYDALGERLATAVSGTVTQFHYNQNRQLIVETNGKTGAVTRQYAWLGDLPLAQIESNGAIYYVHGDQLNTPLKMTNASQAVVWDRVQQPFGATVSATGIASSNLRFPGQYVDAASGLNYNMMRDYDPTLGRYLEADPIGLAGGSNLFSYVGQRPLNATDPLGLCTREELGGEDGELRRELFDYPLEFMFDMFLETVRKGAEVVAHSLYELHGVARSDIAKDLAASARILARVGATAEMISAVAHIYSIAKLIRFEGHAAYKYYETLFEIAHAAYAHSKTPYQQWRESSGMQDPAVFVDHLGYVRVKRIE